MSYTQVKIDDHLHVKMKALASPERGGIMEEYRMAIENHIRSKTQETMNIDSGLEAFINDRINKMDKHLASLIARNCIDTSMTLMGLVSLLENLLKTDKNVIMFKLRKEGANYFKDVVQEDKKNNKSEGEK